jgi:hypothetical protein
MRQFNVGQGGWRRLSALKRVIKSRDKQAILNGIQALRALGVACAHFVQAAIRVREITSSAHGCWIKEEGKFVRIPAYHDTCTQYKG